MASARSPKQHQPSIIATMFNKKTVLAAAVAALAYITVDTRAAPVTFLPDSDPTNPSPQQPSILVVGAGPVGLYTSISLLKSGFTSLTLLEKRTSFTREQVVSITHPNTLNLLNTQSVPGCWQISPSINTKVRCFTDEEHAPGGPFADIPMWKGFQLREIESALLKEFKALGGQIVQGDFKAAVKNGDVESKDVVICADGGRSECRERLVQVQPHRALGEGIIEPDSYGITCILREEFVPEGIKHRFQTDNEIKLRAEHQSRFTGLTNTRGLVYLAMQVTKKEYEEIGGNKPSLSSPIMKGLINSALAHYGLDSLAPVMLKKAQLTSFSIVLKHQPRGGFAKVAEKTKEVSTGNNRQLRFVVGDAAITSNFMTGSGLNIGLDVAQASVEVVKSELKKDSMDFDAIAERINAASFEIASEGIKKSIRVLLPPAM
ncbi:hypothetical protein HK102_002130 [Quaeritorhiza haematococci]|nr:hypothetical protein HK102_002130 [Quaeritorhiza haematococci]